MTITINASAAQFTFEPVVVRRGRKFRGEAYDIGGSYTSSFGYAGSGVCPLQITEKERLWDPVNKRIIYINADYLEDREVSPEQLAADKQAYAEHEILGTIEWCRSTKPGQADDEVLRFARNVLRKRHPEMIQIFDDSFKVEDSRDIVAEIQKTVQWALSLRTRPMHMYGKWCAGGKMYAPKRYTEIIVRSLEKRQLTKLNGFNEVLCMVLDLHDLPHPMA